MVSILRLSTIFAERAPMVSDINFEVSKLMRHMSTLFRGKLLTCVTSNSDLCDRVTHFKCITV